MNEKKGKGSNKILYGIIFLMIGLIIGASAISTTTENNDFPVGSIIMYDGNESDFDLWGWLNDVNYTNWHICNGANGTINLESQYVAGYNPEENEYDTVGETLGADWYNLTVAQLPSHRHSYVDWYPSIRGYLLVPGNVLFSFCDSTATSNKYTGYTGSNDLIDNRPSTTVVMFIQKMM